MEPIIITFAQVSVGRVEFDAEVMTGSTGELVLSPTLRVPKLSNGESQIQIYSIDRE